MGQEEGFFTERAPFASVDLGCKWVQDRPRCYNYFSISNDLLGSVLLLSAVGVFGLTLLRVIPIITFYVILCDIMHSSILSGKYSESRILFGVAFSVLYVSTLQRSSWIFLTYTLWHHFGILYRMFSGILFDILSGILNLTYLKILWHPVPLSCNSFPAQSGMPEASLCVASVAVRLRMFSHAHGLAVLTSGVNSDKT